MRFLTAAAALAGTADTALFLARRRLLFRDHPGRAGGTVFGLTIWSSLAASAVLDRRHHRRTLALAGVVAAANAVLLGAHLRARVVTPRVFLGATLSAVALTASALDGRAR